MAANKVVNKVNTSIYTEHDINKVNDGDVYALNPLFRMQNEHDYVQICAWQVPDANCSVSHAVGITLALFDGKKTVKDIAQIVKPFVDKPDAENATELALWHVKRLVCHYSKSDAERKTQPKPTAVSGAPSNALLISPSIYGQFRGISKPSYNPKAFLPDKAFAKYRDPNGGHKLRAPLYIVWHLTSQCQTNCRYCYLRRRTDAKPLSKERGFTLIKEAHDMGVFYFLLGGGDVILCPHLIDTLEQLANLKSLPVAISTKAYVSKETAKRLAETNMVYEIQFSIDSTIEDIADWMLRTPGFYRRTLESIENALLAGLRVSTKSVITPYNILTIPRMYRELKDRGVDQVRLTTYFRSAYHHTDDLFNHTESVDWLMQELEMLKQKFPDDTVGLQNGAPVLEPLSKEQRAVQWPDMLACSAGRMSMAICVDGKVIPCEQMPEIDANFCGDLNTQSLEEIWHSEEMAKRTTALPREEFKGTPCFECSDRHRCYNIRGFCIRDAAKYYGSIYTPDPNCPKVEQPFIRMR